MKQFYLIPLLVFLLISCNLYSQLQLDFERTGSPIFFGNDIKIEDQEEEDQQPCSICSAPNGWLYAAFLRSDPSEYYHESFCRSVDNGLTWVRYRDFPMATNVLRISKIKTFVTGEDTSNMKLFFGFMYHDLLFNKYAPAVSRFDATTGIVEQMIMYYGSFDYSDISMECDYQHPANGASPFSMAVIYVTVGNFGSDSLVVETSSNGGMSFDDRKVLDINPAFSQYKFGKVSISYGYSPSAPNGQYFAVWEKINKTNNTEKFIYTAHSEPHFDSPFTSPQRIDSLDPTFENNCINPVICCQSSDQDNDSSSFTQVILFQKFNPADNNYDISGFYKLKESSGDQFIPFTLDGSTHNTVHPSVSYNPYSNEFVCTYFDSTSMALPLVIAEMNQPASWSVTTSAYNDKPYLKHPNPYVTISNSQQDAIMTWIEQRENGNGAAMFDSHFSTYNGMDGSGIQNTDLSIKSYPNPCKDKVRIDFNVNGNAPGTIKIVDILGKEMEIINNIPCRHDQQSVEIDVSEYSPGMYFVILKSGQEQASCRILKTSL